MISLEELCEKTNTKRAIKILSTLKNLGVKPNIQGFTRSSSYRPFSSKVPYIGNNIIAKLPKEGKEKILISAHYDKVSKGQGVIDNGCAVYQILELMEYLRDHPANVDITCAFFDCEENGLIGSTHFVKKNQDKFESVFNLDLTGTGDTLFLPSHSSYNYFGDTNKIRIMDPKLNQRLQTVCTNNNIPHYCGGEYGGSDHIPFLDADIPATSISILPKNSVTPILTSKDYRYNFSDMIHTPRDNLSQVDSNAMQMMQDLLIGLIKSYE